MPLEQQPESSQPLMTTKKSKTPLIIGASVALVALVSTLLIWNPGKIFGEDEKHCSIVNNAPEEVIPSQIAAVIAPTNNFVDFETIITASQSSISEDLGSNLSKSEIKNAIGRELSIVIADGVPQLASKRTVKVASDTPSDYDIRDAAITAAFNSFGLVSRCSAGKLKKTTDQIETQAESDLLAGLSIAADQLTEESADKKIYVLANGLQTAGAIKMNEPGEFPKSEAYATQLAQGLEDIGALPDLHGTRVIWYGLGQVDGDHQVLSQKAKDSLTYFWQEVISRSNGVLVTDDIYGEIGSGKPDANAIKVSNLAVTECKLLVKLYEDDGVEFKPDSSVFVDSGKAKDAAKMVADSFKKAECDELTIHGYAAAGVDKATYDSKKSDIDETNKTLTLSRAKAFAALVKRAGFTGTINTEGVGTCGTEWNKTGKIAPELQKLCRRVEVSN
jgi:hypothetical protein